MEFQTEVRRDFCFLCDASRFVDSGKVTSEVKDHLGESVAIEEYDAVLEFLKGNLQGAVRFSF